MTSIAPFFRVLAGGTIQRRMTSWMLRTVVHAPVVPQILPLIMDARPSVVARPTAPPIDRTAGPGAAEVINMITRWLTDWLSPAAPQQPVQVAPAPPPPPKPEPPKKPEKTDKPNERGWVAICKNGEKRYPDARAFLFRDEDTKHDVLFEKGLAPLGDNYSMYDHVIEKGRFGAAGRSAFFGACMAPYWKDDSGGVTGPLFGARNMIIMAEAIGIEVEPVEFKESGMYVDEREIIVSVVPPEKIVAYLDKTECVCYFNKRAHPDVIAKVRKLVETNWERYCYYSASGPHSEKALTFVDWPSGHK